MFMCVDVLLIGFRGGSGLGLLRTMCVISALLTPSTCWTKYCVTTTRYALFLLFISSHFVSYMGLFDLLFLNLTTTQQERLTAREAMSHPYFAPVRAGVHG